MHMKPWGWTSIAAICFVGYAVLSRASPAPGESCGLGLPPGAPGFAETEARKEAEVRKNGFLRVCEADLKRYDISFRPMAQAADGLAFPPVTVAEMDARFPKERPCK